MECKVFFAGSLFMTALIASFGPQNMFVLHTGLQRRHTAEVVLICIAGDVMLGFAGLLGMNLLVGLAPQFIPILKLIAAVMLLCWMFSAMKRLVHPQLMEINVMERKAAILGACALTFLNPYVYLDTVFLLGTKAVLYGEPQKWWFLCGALSVSCLWYTTIGFGAQGMSRFAGSPIFCRLLSLFTLLAMTAALIMLMRIPPFHSPAEPMTWQSG